MSRSSVWVTGRCLPVRMKNGTPSQRQLSISSRIAAYVSVAESAATPSIVAVAVVLPAHVVRRVGGGHGREHRVEGVLERARARRRLHRRGADHLHEVVDDHVAHRADRVVEVPAVLDAEVLRHRDLDAGHVLAAPDRLEDRVREAEVEDLGEPHLPQEVVDPVQLRLVDVAVDLDVERLRRGHVVAERLLDHDPRVLGQPGRREPADHGAEQEGRDLEVEDRRALAVERRRDPPERAPGRRSRPGRRTAARRGGRRPPRRPARRRSDRLARAPAQIVDGPVVDRDADDRAVDEPALLQPVERAEGHDLREVTGDPEHHEDVRGLVAVRRFARRHLRMSGNRHADSEPPRPLSALTRRG